MRNYELVWILGGEATDEQSSESIDKVKTLVANAGGEVENVKPWGRRTLAYPIRKNTEGYYIEAQFTMDGEKTQELDRALVADEGIIRHLIVRNEVKASAGPASDSDDDS